ncbi:hypothetical protein LTR97_001427 [Elasticomyces elasticus]|uniref:Uncharacterized protein n=1 Tax=Elasticomyces elasticus TaxID=574655 RepID=A0AAN7WBK0_9PEZI|nr:hypothetical protein LTR97_001427 [Elasticomyces elasticus]
MADYLSQPGQSSSTATTIPRSPPTGFSRVDDMMAAARAKYAANPALVAKIRADTVTTLPNPLPPTPEALDFSERVDRAIAKPTSLIAGTQAQLTAPVSAFLPAELTPEDVEEQEKAEVWMQNYRRTDERIDCMLANNQKLFDDVMSTFDQMQADPMVVPHDRTVSTAVSVPPKKDRKVPGAFPRSPAVQSFSQPKSFAMREKRPSDLLRFEMTGNPLDQHCFQPSSAARETRRKRVKLKRVNHCTPPGKAAKRKLYSGIDSSTSWRMDATTISTPSDNEDNASLAASSGDTFLVDILMQQARLQAQARMRRQLPSLSSSRRSSLEEQVHVGHRIDRCAALAEKLLGQAEACLQRPLNMKSAPDDVGEHVTLQQRSNRCKRTSQADGMTTNSRRLYRDVIDELNMSYSAGALLLKAPQRPSSPLLPPSHDLEMSGDQQTQSPTQRKTRMVEEPSGVLEMRKRKKLDVEQSWKNLANASVDVTWQCAIQ